MSNRGGPYVKIAVHCSFVAHLPGEPGWMGVRTLENEVTSGVCDACYFLPTLGPFHGLYFCSRYPLTFFPLLVTNVILISNGN